MNTNLNPFSENDHNTIKAQAVKYAECPVTFSHDDYWTMDEENRMSAYSATAYVGKHRA